MLGHWGGDACIASSLSSNREHHFVFDKYQGKQKARRSHNNGCHWHRGWHQTLFCVLCRMPPLPPVCICRISELLAVQLGIASRYVWMYDSCVFPIVDVLFFFFFFCVWNFASVEILWLKRLVLAAGKKGIKKKKKKRWMSSLARRAVADQMRLFTVVLKISVGWNLGK